MSPEQAKVLAEKAELIRQLSMSQLPTAQMANPTLHGLLRDIVMKAMNLRDDIMAAAEEPKIEEEQPAPKKRGRPKKKMGE